jgi:hypothetical protein
MSEFEVLTGLPQRGQMSELLLLFPPGSVTAKPSVIQEDVGPA